MDVIDLRDFYSDSLGRMVARMLRLAAAELWPDLAGERVLGLGYGLPVLKTLEGRCERVIAAMPDRQGVLHWPRRGAGLTLLSDEESLPFADRAMDRILLLHAAETAPHPQQLLRELWRILSDRGRLLIIVPNRRGIWARSERTPFGYGHPYSPGQVSRLLRDTMYTPLRIRPALFLPPTRSRVMLASAMAWEKIGRKCFPAFSGLILVEAGKQLYGAPAKIRERRKSFVPVPAATPARFHEITPVKPAK